MSRSLSFLALLSGLLWTAEVLGLESRRAPVSLSAEEIAQRKAAAKAALERWLAAQNTGDFEGYLAMYAPQFHGVRRSRLQTVRLGRAGWAKDRAKMFAKPMKVAAEDVQILPGKTMVKLLFVQRWSSGNYSDVGPKRIDLVESKGAWLIAGEEMLASHPPTPMEVVPATQAGQFAFVHEGDVVLAHVQDMCDGPSSLEETMNGYVIRCPVKPVSIPKELSGWRDERVTLYGKEGAGCTTRLSAFEMIGRVYIMPMTEEGVDEGEGVNERARHKAIWSHAMPLLVGTASGCGEGPFYWARLASQPKPVRAQVADLPAGLAGAVKRSFHALSGWSEAQSECGKGGKPWEESAEQNDRLLVTARLGTESMRFVVMSANSGDCAASCGSLFGVWRLYGSGKQTVFSPVASAGSSRYLLAAFDADGDGQLEFLFGNSEPEIGMTLWRLDDGKLVAGPSIVTLRWLGCGC